MTGVQEFNGLLRKIKYDEQARDEFFRNYYNLLRQHVFRKYGNLNDWEDILHDVVKKLIETDWTSYPYIENPTSWLYTIADNHAKDVFKKSNRLCEYKEEKYPGFNLENLEIRSDVRDALKRLNYDMQYILISHFWLGKELYLIAEEMGKSYISVRVTAWRARTILKKYL